MDLMSYLERATSLDRLTEAVQRVVRKLPPGKARDALYGVWLGHPLHPVLVQVPVGTWLSASLLDARPGNERASRHLVLAGLAAAVPAVLAGAADWSQQHEQQMRTGLVHAAANVAAIAAYAASTVVAGRRRSACGWPGWPPPGPADSSAATSPTASPPGPTRPRRSRTWLRPAGMT